MKCYEMIIKPRSGFGTPLKGDTLFGQFCWQVRYDQNLLNDGLDKWIGQYAENPFIVFSSAWPKLSVEGKGCYVLKRPDLPLSTLFPEEEVDREAKMLHRKDKAKQKWLLVGEDLRINLNNANYIDDSNLAQLVFGELTEETKRLMRGKNRRITSEFLQPHNTINRQTLTTGEGMFAPHAMMATYYYPEIEFAVFVLLDEKATDIERVQTALERIGTRGFGRDASTGMGRYDLGEVDEKPFPKIPRANAYYTLAPIVPEKGLYHDCYFKPFTRFGRHGDALAVSPNPFKNPVIMADDGAVLVPKAGESVKNPYLGTAVHGLSKSESRTVAQGYAPFLPLNLEMQP